MKRMALVCLAGLLAVSGVSCPPPNPTPKQRVAGLRGFSSPDELKQYLADQATATSQRSTGSVPFFSLALPMAGGVANSAPMETASDSVSSGDGTGTSFSTTNIQEAGVDESDVVKNDGQTIFALDQSDPNVIHVVRAMPAGQMAQLTTITIPATGDSLYLTGKTLVALSRPGYLYSGYFGGFGGAPMPAVGMASPAATSATKVMPAQTGTAQSGSGSAGSATVVEPSAPSDVATTTVAQPAEGPFGSNPQTTITVIDVTDPANPVVRATANFEGQLEGSRLVGNKLHLILTSFPRFPDNPTTAGIRSMPVEQWLPRFQVADGGGAVLQSGQAVGWQNVFRPESPDGYEVTTVVTMDVADPSLPFSTTAITANTGIIYASTEAIYLTDTNYDYQDYTSREDTIVHKLAFIDTGTDYVASGLIPGRPLSQYSLGEFNGYLRIATHINSWTATPMPAVQPDAAVSNVASSQSMTVQNTNNVYVLGANGQSLDVVGKIEDIAPGETIYSARFIGKRGFLVTFKRIDPLFTMDLSDPTNPKIVGELKVPGYSDHIQMLDENHLLTIGKDAQDTGTFAWVQGVQVSLFDITDAANPVLQDQVIIGGRGTNSEANQNPKAFNYFAPLNALAFPVDLWDGETMGPEIGTHNFSGLYVYRVTAAEGFSLLGRINMAQQTSNCFWGWYGYTRGLFMGNNVYAVTGGGVKAADLGDVSTVTGQVNWAQPPDANCYNTVDIMLPPGGGLE